MNNNNMNINININNMNNNNQNQGKDNNLHLLKSIYSLRMRSTALDERLLVVSFIGNHQTAVLWLNDYDELEQIADDDDRGFLLTEETVWTGTTVRGDCWIQVTGKRLRLIDCHRRRCVAEYCASLSSLSSQSIGEGEDRFLGAHYIATADWQVIVLSMSGGRLVMLQLMLGDGLSATNSADRIIELQRFNVGNQGTAGSCDIACMTGGILPILSTNAATSCTNAATSCTNSTTTTQSAGQNVVAVALWDAEVSVICYRLVVTTTTTTTNGSLSLQPLCRLSLSQSLGGRSSPPPRSLLITQMNSSNSGGQISNNSSNSNNGSNSFNGSGGGEGSDYLLIGSGNSMRIIYIC